MQKIISLSLMSLYLITVVFNIAYADNRLSTAETDIYLRGYLDSLFKHGYELPIDTVTVKNNIITVNEDIIGYSRAKEIAEKITRSISNLKFSRQIKVVRQKSSGGKGRTALVVQEEYVDHAMPSTGLFQPLIADPKWPRFTVAYQYYMKDKTLKHAFAPNFGASFPIYRIVNTKTNIEWEVGIQAGLFGLMDIGSTPTALINADYYVSMPVTYRNGATSGLVRFYHQSSHLGDEYMLTEKGKKTKRINLSYEGIDLIFSYHLNSLRFYGGGGYILHKDPSYVKPLKLQAGSEYYSHNTYLGGRLRPVSAIDIKVEELKKMQPDFSVKTGVQLENASLLNSKVQLMLEYFKGKSIHGQFYNDKVEYIGVGVQGFL